MWRLQSVPLRASAGLLDIGCRSIGVFQAALASNAERSVGQATLTCSGLLPSLSFVRCLQLQQRQFIPTQLSAFTPLPWDRRLPGLRHRLRVCSELCCCCYASTPVVTFTATVIDTASTPPLVQHHYD